MRSAHGRRLVVLAGVSLVAVLWAPAVPAKMFFVAERGTDTLSVAPLRVRAFLWIMTQPYAELCSFVIQPYPDSLAVPPRFYGCGAPPPLGPHEMDLRLDCTVAPERVTFSLPRCDRQMGRADSLWVVVDQADFSLSVLGVGPEGIVDAKWLTYGSGATTTPVVPSTWGALKVRYH